MISDACPQSCQAHVEYFYVAFVIQQKIGRLDVSMHDALGMRVLKPFGRLQQIIQCQVCGDGTKLFQHVRKIMASDILHH